MSNKGITRFLLSFLTLCLVISIFGLGYKEDKVAVKKYFKNLNKVRSEKDIDKLEKYSKDSYKILLLANELQNSIPNVNKYSQKERDKLFNISLKTVTQIPKYKIIKNEEKREDLKLITLKLKIVDLGHVKWEFSKGKKDNVKPEDFDEIYNKMQRIYQTKEDEKYKEKTVKVYIKKEKNRWILNTDNEFYKELYS